MLSNTFFGAVAFATTVAAHGFIETITINGQSQPGYNPTNAPWTPDQDTIGWKNWATDTGFVPSSSVSSPDIICHLSASNAPKSASVAAGTTVDLKWTGWPQSHKGPIMDYIADCGGPCESVNKENLKWVKIAHMGQLGLGAGGGQTGYWAADKLSESGFVWKVTIPANLAAGNYVLRHEILALHEAGEEGKAQFYPQCMSFSVTGGGSTSIAGQGVAGTQLYGARDAGVLYSIYNDETNPTYQIPGPAPFSF